MNEGINKDLDSTNKATVNKGKRFRHRLFFIILLVVFFMIGYFSAIIFNPPEFVSPYKLDKESLVNIPFFNDDLYAEVYGLLKSAYVDEQKIDDQALFYGALRGMVNAIHDPYTTYLDPETQTKFTAELDGTFSGIGAEIGMKEDRLTIIAPLANSPAEKAGLRPGDIILAVDKTDSTGLSLDEVIALIRGDIGTAVVLSIYRADDSFETQEISIIREKIVVPTAEWRLDDDIAIINLYNFNQESGNQLVAALLEISRNDVSGLILDIRSNPGGFLDKAVDIASAWIEPEQIVVREIFSDSLLNHEYQAIRQIRAPSVPTVVLVNEGSASASEIVAGALQDYNLATIVGKQTYGKGSVQDLRSLSDGSGLKITVAQWLTPNGRIINDQGIEPDIEVDLTLDDYLNDRDPQMEKALEIINQINSNL